MMCVGWPWEMVWWSTTVFVDDHRRIPQAVVHPGRGLRVKLRQKNVLAKLKRRLERHESRLERPRTRLA